METIIVVVVSLLLGMGLAVVWTKSRRESPKSAQTTVAANSPREIVRMEPDNTALDVLEEKTASPQPYTYPERVVVNHGTQEVMSVSLLNDADALTLQHRGAIRLPEQAFSGPLLHLVEPLMQVAPSTGTAVMANSSKLMEVTINGQMLAAVDGNGLRAIAKAPRGFEHARLYEPNNLQNVANAAAIWQIVSVVVAQKHLADISTTLKRLESKVDDVKDLIEAERYANIPSAMKYLNEVRNAIEAGEFLERTRDKLETIEMNLDRVSISLIEQMRRKVGSELEKDNFGCQGEYDSALKKHNELNRLAGELTLCNEVRLANWYLCSLFPDNSRMLDPRIEQISKTLDEAKELKTHLQNVLDLDCKKISARFTSDETIKTRQLAVKSKVEIGHLAIDDGLLRCDAILNKLESVRTARQATTRLMVETTDGAPSAVYLCQ